MKFSILFRLTANCVTGLQVAADADQQTIEQLAQASESVQRHIEGKTVRKIIVVPGRLVNIVVA